MDLVRIAVAVEIAPEHDSVLVSAWDWRQLGLERGALSLAAAAEGFGQRKAVELRQVLHIARLMRGNLATQKGSAQQQRWNNDIA